MVIYIDLDQWTYCVDVLLADDCW